MTKNNILKNQKLIESIMIFIIFGGFTALLNLNDLDFEYDKLWIIHMMQKVANGDLMYSEINILVGPIFYVLGGLVFKIFGTSFYVFDVFSGLLYGAFAVLSYNICKELNHDNDWKINLLFCAVLYYFARILCIGAYNLLSLFFILAAMLVEIKKNKSERKSKSNLLIGIFLGLAFFSKQTVAGMAIIATGLITLIDYLIIEKKNPLKEIFEKAGGFFIVFIPIILLMALCGNLIDYIDLCFGGILEFGSKNVSIVMPNLYLAFMLGTLIASAMLIKFCGKDKEFLIITLYAIAASFFSVPLFNSYHAHLSTFCIWFLIIKIIKFFQKHEKLEIVKIIECISVVLLLISIYTLGGENLSAMSNEMSETGIFSYIATLILDISVILLLGIEIMNSDNKRIKIVCICFLLLAIGILVFNFCVNFNDKEIPKGLEMYAKHGFDKKEIKRIEEVINYIKLKESEGYNVMVITSDASKYMIPLNRNNNKYDLLLNGNLGYGGSSKVLDEMRGWENTLIMQNKDTFWQEPQDIRSYVENSLNKVDEIGGLEVYLKD